MPSPLGLGVETRGPGNQEREPHSGEKRTRMGLMVRRRDEIAEVSDRGWSRRELPAKGAAFPYSFRNAIGQLSERLIHKTGPKLCQHVRSEFPGYPSWAQ